MWVRFFVFFVERIRVRWNLFGNFSKIKWIQAGVFRLMVSGCLSLSLLLVTLKVLQGISTEWQKNMLFQPDILFQRRGISPAAEQRICNSFASAGRPHGTEGNAVVKPKNEFRDPPLKWWKIGGRGEIAEPPPAVPLKALPTKPDRWRFPDNFRSFIPSIGEEVSKAWESSLKELGPLLSWEYDEGIELGCPAMLLYLEACKGELGMYRQNSFPPHRFSFGWHGTSEAHAREIMRDGFDPSKRSIHAQDCQIDRFLCHNPHYMHHLRSFFQRFLMESQERDHPLRLDRVFGDYKRQEHGRKEDKRECCNQNFFSDRT